MKVLTKVKFILSFIVIMGLIFNKVNAASVSVKAESNTSEILTNKVVYINLSLTNFVDIDTSDDMAMSGSIEYDNSIFENVEMEAVEGWTNEFNSESGKFVIDTSSTTENQTVARFKLTVAENISTLDTQIHFYDISITNNNNLNISNLDLTVNIRVSNNNQDDNQQDTNEENNNEQQPSTEDPNEDPNGNTDNGQGGNNQENPNDQENNENGNQNQQENNNETTTDGVKEPEANSIGQVGDLTVAKDPIPQTGVSYIALGIIALVIIIGLIAFWRYKKFVRLMNKGV